MAQTLAEGDDAGTGAMGSFSHSVPVGAWAHGGVTLHRERPAGSPSLQLH